MLPFLLDWNVNGVHFKIPTYGALLATAFTVAYYLSLKRAIREGEDPRHIENLFLIVILASILGSRLFHVLFEEPVYYLKNPGKIIAVWEGGYTLYGALLSSILGIYIYCRRKKLAFLEFADIAAPATFMGIAIGRLGCFAAGCCWGKPTSLLWGVKFTNPQAFTLALGKTLHPTQLYESLGALLIFFYTSYLFKHRKYKGQIVFHGLFAYSILRTLVEFFRGDDYRGYLIDPYLSYSQAISLAILPFVIYGMARCHKKNAAE